MDKEGQNWFWAGYGWICRLSWPSSMGLLVWSVGSLPSSSLYFSLCIVANVILGHQPFRPGFGIPSESLETRSLCFQSSELQQVHRKQPRGAEDQRGRKRPQNGYRDIRSCIVKCETWAALGRVRKVTTYSRFEWKETADCCLVKLIVNGNGGWSCSEVLMEQVCDVRREKNRKKHTESQSQWEWLHLMWF